VPFKLRGLWRDREMARRRPRDAARYALRSRELSNFTYELENESEIEGFLAGPLATPPERIAGYLEELRSDEELLTRLRRALAANPRRDDEPRLGKRRALYCAVRAERPQVVAESGVHDGLGSVVLLRALERNEAEGGPRGRLLGFDINPDAGWLVEAAEGFELIVGDARETLKPALARDGVDLLVQDSLKEHSHETFELEAAAANRRGDRLILYSDDASATGALREVCARHRGRSSFLREVPRDHYWRGNELGLCVID
jgi:predicted O-methyltransferase YrrM